MSINRKFFFEQIRNRLFGGKLSVKQVEGMTAILDEWETNHWEKDDRFLAYIFATIFHETDRRFEGIAEYGKGKTRRYGQKIKMSGARYTTPNQIYYGRGFVQLTWFENYEKFSKILGIDLLNNPDLALDLQNCVKITFHGMLNGSFTGRKLADYFSPTKQDWSNARRIINGTDKMNLIADYAKKFYSAISYTV